MSTKYQIIVDIWERMEKEVVGAPELELIQQALAVRFGAIVSLASIARTLADHGVRLGHPDILTADVKWRSRTLIIHSRRPDVRQSGGRNCADRKNRSPSSKL